MERYFIEVFYQGARYAGFQAQENANTIQAEVEKAFKIYYRVAFSLTGSSRTDAGVHALQNFFHVDTSLFEGRDEVMKDVYHLNAILPSDIVIRNIYKVLPEAHCRFSAAARSYQYTLYSVKNPFYESTGYFFPYPLQLNKLNEAADYLKHQTNFEAFAKKNSQVHSFICSLKESTWHILEDRLLYTVTGNRFLRGMVRGLVGTMLKVGTGKTSIEDFKNIVEAGDARRADFSVPPQGLCLMKVHYPF